MAEKIMVSCQKGGVAKSTTAVILSEILAVSGYRVLVIDLDTQGNATQMLTQKSIYEYSGKTVLEAIKSGDAAEYVVHVKDNIDLLPAEDMLATFSRYIYTNKFSNHLTVLKNVIVQIEQGYDYIIMDCPPNLGDLVLNALVYTDYVIIPVQPDAFGMDALDRYISFVGEAKAEGHTEAEVLGVVLTMKDKRSVMERLICKNIRASYGETVFKSEINKRAKIKEFALTGVTMDKKADLKALSDYFNLTEELIDRVQRGFITKQDK